MNKQYWWNTGNNTPESFQKEYELVFKPMMDKIREKRGDQFDKNVKFCEDMLRGTHVKKTKRKSN